MYCTLNDILAQIEKLKLIDLSNDDTEPLLGENGEPTINTPNIDKAISSATGEIDSYVSVRHRVPLSPVPAVINKLAVDIAIYNLFSRKYTGEEEDNIVRRYKNAVKLLEKIAEGKVQLGVSESSIFYSSPGKVFGDAFRKEYD